MLDNYMKPRRNFIIKSTASSSQVKFSNRLSILFYCALPLVFTFTVIHTIWGQEVNADSLISMLGTSKADTARVLLLYQISSSLYDNNPEKAIYYANQGLELGKKINFKKGISLCLHELGLAYLQIGKLDSSMIYYNKRKELVTELNDSIGLAAIFDNIGIIYVHYGDLDKALILRGKANEIYLSLKMYNNVASGYTWIGNIYKEQGEYPLALENYLKAVKIYEEENNEKEIGYPLLNISSVYRYLKQYDVAEKYAMEAKEKFEKAGNTNLVGASLYRLANIFLEEEIFPQAIIYANQAKKISEETHNTYSSITSNLQIGNIYSSMGNLDSAIIYFNYALPSALQMGDKPLISNVYQNIGFVYQNMGNYIQALEYMYLSDKLLQEINDRNALLEISENFMGIYSNLNQPDSIYRYFRRYQELSNALFNEQSSQAIAEMQARFQTEKNEKEIIALSLENEKKKNHIARLNNLNEIASLKLENSIIENEKNAQALTLSNTEREKQQAQIEIHKLTEIKQAQAIQDEKNNKRFITWIFISSLLALIIIFLFGFLYFRNKKQKEQAILNQKAAELSRQVAENDMKALRSQMNPHFIFNCVQTVERLLNDSKINESKTCLMQFSNLTRRVLENSKKREIPLAEELQTVRLYMDLENARFSVPFAYDISIETGIDPETTLLPPLILQPFVENSIKHGFHGLDKPGEISIEVKKENESLVCILKDNGIGRKESLKIKSISGYKKESIGMKLTEERLHLISELKKTTCFFSIEDVVDSLDKPLGTRIKMYLPFELSI